MVADLTDAIKVGVYRRQTKYHTVAATVARSGDDGWIWSVVNTRWRDGLTTLESGRADDAVAAIRAAADALGCTYALALKRRTKLDRIVWFIDHRLLATGVVGPDPVWRRNYGSEVVEAYDSRDTDMTLCGNHNVYPCRTYAPDNETWTTVGAPGSNPEIRKCPACEAIIASRAIIGGA